MGKNNTPNSIATLDAETAERIVDSIKRTIIIQTAIYLSGRSNPPGVCFGKDADAYYAPSENMIHLGIYAPLEIFNVCTKEDYISAMTYLSEHEDEHFLSTANVPYDNGIKRAVHAVVDYIAAKEGIHKIFRNDKDYEVFIDSVLPSKGIHISHKVLTKICAHLMNSVEDGRIERIRSLKYPGFASMRKYFRAILWNRDVEHVNYENMSDMAKLEALLDNTWSLATTGLHTKGFVAAYCDTPLMDEAIALIPNITKAVLAKRTREMADNVVEIAKKLAPYIYVACKKSDAIVAFEKMLNQLLSAIFSNLDTSKMAPTSERDEIQDDGIPMPVFPISDLVIELDDDEYDKLMENAKKNKSGNAGIMVKRKNPKPEDKRDDDNDDGNNESKHGSRSSGGGKNGSIETVLEQMEKAAAECRADSTELISNINQGIDHSPVGNSTPIIENNDKPITEESVKDLCKGYGFKEVLRKYDLDQALPPLLMARTKTFRKKMSRFFKSMSTPTVTHRDSGAVDPSRIYSLTMGETNVFRKNGADRNFDGCAYLLLDNSGSTSGNKRMEECKAAAVVEEGFKGLMPLKIVAFDTCGPVIHQVIKGWNESQKNNCCWNFALHGRQGAGNDDHVDIMIAQKELLARPERKKLLIILSDGAPSNCEAVKKAVEMTRKSGIKVVSIYFEEGKIGRDATAFKKMYQYDYICCQLSDVDNELTKLMVKFSRS